MKGKKIFGFIVMVLCFISFSCTVFAANTVMKNKKWVTGQGGVYEKDEEGYISYNSYDTSYYKIKIPKQGYIIVDVKTSSLPGEDEYNSQDDEYGEDFDHTSYTKVSLLNSSKKAFSENDNFLSEKKNFSFSWAVKKGTYYLAVDGNQQYKIRYFFTPVGKVSKAGKGMKSAVSLKKGVTVKNLLNFFPDEDHYYKINFPKKTKITFTFDCKFKGTGITVLCMQLYSKKGKDYRLIDEKGKLVSKDEAIWWEINGKDKVVLNLSKGTYYIRMYSLGSGYYTMKWK